MTLHKWDESNTSEFIAACPACRSSGRLSVSAHMALINAEDTLAKVQLWENRRTAAAYAWRAQEDSK